MKKLSYVVVGVILLTLSTSVASAHSRKSQEWFDSKEWLQGATFRPAASIDIEEFAAHYKAHPNRWNKLFSILKNADIKELPLGLQVIDENLKMNVQEYETRPTVGRKLLYEKHCQYIDVQCVLSGAELQGTVKIEQGEVVKAYNEERDIAMYVSRDVPFYLISAGEFTIFFPDDIHTTNYGFGERTTARKIVFKVKYE